jgi:adenylate cyclase
MSYRKIRDPNEVWGDWFATSAFAIDKRLRQIFRWLPHDPRCKFCSAPFEGLGGSVVKVIFGKQRSGLNPNFCNMCEEASRQFPGGNEVPMSMLFADVRGSTAISQTMSAGAFSQLINRFYTVATS